MKKINIMLACAAGMSTSLMVIKMKDAAVKRNVECDIFAIPATEASKVLEEEKIDVILLGPQLAYMEDDIIRIVGTADIPIDVINMVDYGTMNGEKVLDFAFDLYERNKQ